MNLKEDLKTGKKSLGVWGLGYIGFSSIAYFARAGVACIGTDIAEQRIKDVNQGKVTIPNFQYWLGFDVKRLAGDGMMKATSNWQELIDKDVAVHLITIPTEKDGEPYHEILKDVINKISKFKDVETEYPPLVIAESTLTPTAADNIVVPLFKKNGLEVGKDILFGVAPRRDWFTESDKTLKTLPRVVGGTTKKTTELMADVLGIICDTIIKAQDHKHAAIVKSIENAYRQLDITFANQLSLAYPDMDITDVLKMVGTKWNIGCYSPDTSILTDEGFVRVDKLKKGKKIWSINPKNKHLELATAEKMYSGVFDGYMIRGKKKRYGVDFLITPNHNLPVLVHNNTKKIKFIKAEDALNYKKIRLVNDIKWTGKSKCDVPLFVKNKKEPYKWLSLLGWFISEGSLYHKKGTGNYNVIIYQEKGVYHNEIYKLFLDLGFNPNHRTEKGKGRIRVSNKKLYDYLLKKVGKTSYDKKIPKEILGLNNHHLKHIFDSLIKGDGSRYKKEYKYITVSKKLKDNMCELALKLGFHVKIYKQNNIFKINICKVKNHELSPIKRKFKDASFGPQLFKQKFKGIVYCPALDKNHILIIERDGCISINGNSFHPSFGTGGYCIPLAPQYVLEGAKYPERLTLIKESLKTDFSQPETVVNSLIKRGVQKVAVLGIAYTGDLKVHVLSPGIPIAKLLKKNGIDVKVNDPYYSDDEIKEITGCESFKFPEGLSDRDAVIIVSPHMQYKYTNTQEIFKNLSCVKLILDNMGIWNDLKFAEGVEYHEAGNANWLE